MSIDPKKHFDFKTVGSAMLSALSNEVIPNILTTTLPDAAPYLQLPVSELTSCVLIPASLGQAAGNYVGTELGDAINTGLIKANDYLMAKRQSVQFGIMRVNGGNSFRAIDDSPVSFKTGGLSSQEANIPFIEANKRPPYTDNTRTRIICLQHERVLVRVHTTKNPIGVWIMRPKDIEGLTPLQIKDKFALPEFPTHISNVHLPVRSYLQLGKTSPQEEWGLGGGIQYQLLDWLDSKQFSNTLTLEEYQNQLVGRFKP